MKAIRECSVLVMLAASSATRGKKLKPIAFLCLASLPLFVPVAAQQTKQHSNQTGSAVRKRVFVDGTAIAVSKVITKGGVTYVDVGALADALGFSVKSEEGGLMITSSAKPSCQSKNAPVEGLRISEQFRHDVAGIADEIESLRAVVLKLKKETAIIGPRFDEIDRKLSLSKVHVQTEADMAVYYALSYANNSLAIIYYKQARGVPSQDWQKDQLDSMMCSMESKFALMRGALLPGGSCSVFKRRDAELSLKPTETPDEE